MLLLCVDRSIGYGKRKQSNQGKMVEKSVELNCLTPDLYWMYEGGTLKAIWRIAKTQFYSKRLLNVYYMYGSTCICIYTYVSLDCLVCQMDRSIGRTLEVL